MTTPTPEDRAEAIRWGLKPLPIETRIEIAAAIQAAVAAERERCATIADIAATQPLGDPARIIAARIRIDPAKGE